MTTNNITSYCEECGRGLTEETLMLKTVIKRTPWGREPEVIVVCKERCLTQYGSLLILGKDGEVVEETKSAFGRINFGRVRIVAGMPQNVLQAADAEFKAFQAHRHVFVQDSIPRITGLCDYTFADGDYCGLPRAAHLARPSFSFAGKLKDLMRKLNELVTS